MVDLIVFILLVFTGLFFGSIIEKRHYNSIKKREKLYRKVKKISLKEVELLYDPKDIEEIKLVSSSVVISIDAFKKFFASLINIIGGRVISYETLLDRARREAILRLIENSPGVDCIANIRITTSSISNNTKSGVGTVEVLAYGTAIWVKK